MKNISKKKTPLQPNDYAKIPYYNKRRDRYKKVPQIVAQITDQKVAQAVRQL